MRPLLTLTREQVLQFFCRVQLSITVSYPRMSQMLGTLRNAMIYSHCQRRIHQDRMDKTKTSLKLKKWLWKSHRERRRTFRRLTILQKSMPRKWQMVPKYINIKMFLSVKHDCKIANISIIQLPVPKCFRSNLISVTMYTTVSCIKWYNSIISHCITWICLWLTGAVHQ